MAFGGLRLEAAQRQQRKQILFPSLEARLSLWQDRFYICQDAGIPEMIAACTKRFKDISDPETRAKWIIANNVFKLGVIQFVESNLGQELDNNRSIGVELFTGAGIFYRYFAKRFARLYGFELNPDTAEYLRHKVLEDGGNPHLIYSEPSHQLGVLVTQGLVSPGSVKVVMGYRGFLHQPYEECVSTIATGVEMLEPGGWFIVGELFRNEKTRHRRHNNGTWYRTREFYSSSLGPSMSLEHLSDVIDYDGDPCRVALWRKKMP